VAVDLELEAMLRRVVGNRVVHVIPSIGVVRYGACSKPLRVTNLHEMDLASAYGFPTSCSDIRPDAAGLVA
jgi:hypothetical protein